MKETKKNQKFFKNQTVLKLTEKDFSKKCLACDLCSWSFSVVLIPESCKEQFLTTDIKNIIITGMVPNGVIAYY